LNAADEEAVAAFLAGQLPFSGIAVVIEKVLERMQGQPLENIDDVLNADAEARRLAREEISRRKS
jgi:1-deoxy-D-xylulose-5-phosphate reductoisomerase